MKAYEIALKQYGLREIPGDESNRESEKFFESLDFDFTGYIAWHSAFMNICQYESGNPITGKLNAKSWLKWGEATENPDLGDVVVFHRGDPTG